MSPAVFLGVLWLVDIFAFGEDLEFPASDRTSLIAERKRKGILIGEKRGEQQGRRSEKPQTARNMKANGLSTDMIMKCTGLTVEQIAEL